MTRFYISYGERDTRFGVPKDKTSNSKKAVIINLKNDEIGWGQTCLLNHMISHPEFFDLMKALHIVDLTNIERLKNPEIPFILKNINNLTELLKTTKKIPLDFVQELKTTASNLLDSIYNLEQRSRALHVFSKVKTK